MPLTRSLGNAGQTDAAGLIPGCSNPDLSPLSSDQGVEQSLYNINMGTWQIETMIDPMLIGTHNFPEHWQMTEPRNAGTPMNTTTLDDSIRANNNRVSQQGNVQQGGEHPARELYSREHPWLIDNNNRVASKSWFIGWYYCECTPKHSIKSDSFDDGGKEPKVNNPDVCQGERSKLTNFLIQIYLVFKIHNPRSKSLLRYRLPPQKRVQILS